MLHIIGVVLLGLFSVNSTNTSYGQFEGGTISFSVRNDSSGKLVADLDVLTGWVLHKGPCGNHCGKADIGKSTHVGRAQTKANIGDKWYFGNWTSEYHNISRVTKFRDITSEIDSNMTEVLMRMNTDVGWEQDQMKVSVELDVANTDRFHKYEDIQFNGHIWRTPTMQSYNIDWHLQTKIDSRLRNDTGFPNRSPIALMRPVYRIPLNTISEIHIATTDPDNDYTRCEHAVFSESGRLSKYPLPGLTIHENCTITIDTNTRNGYYVNSWGAVALIVKDYSTQLITLGTALFYPYDNAQALSTCSVQFMVQVLDNFDAPTFVSPTAPANRHFILYSGTTWRQKLYAKSNGNTTISEFRVLGREQETFIVSGIHDGDELNVKFVDVQWTPAITDTRNHIVCVTAVDDTGMESDEDRCFSIGTKNIVFNRSTKSLKNAPYFNRLPAQGQLVECDIDVTCAIPLFIKSDAGVERIHISRTDFAITTTGPVSKVNQNGQHVYKSDLSFSDIVPGLKTICVIAIDRQGKQSAEECIQSKMLPVDPCISSPCLNTGVCSRSKENPADYNCHCWPRFHGSRCEIRESACDPNPCKHGVCYTIPPAVYFCDCRGTGYTGKKCSQVQGHCLPGSCNAHGVCSNVTAGHTCTCLDRFSGPDCSIDKCPHESSTEHICPISLHNASNRLSYFDKIAAKPYKVECTYNTSCPIPVSYVGPNNKRPIGTGSIFYGFELVAEFQNLSGYKTNETSSIEVLSFRFKTHDNHRVCLHTTDTGHVNGKMTDQLCIGVEITDVHVSTTGQHQSSVIQERPHFSFSSLQSGSIYYCEKESPCHVWVTTDSMADGYCHSVIKCLSSIVDVRIAPPVKYNTTCITDVVVKTSTHFGQLCLSAGPSGEQRTFGITTDYSAVHMPCQPNPCVHGKCSEVNSFASCQCDAGYIGERCDKKPFDCRTDRCINGVCQHLIFSSHCVCDPGYIGQRCGTSGTIIGVLGLLTLL